jgi:hypothetical protein
MFCRKAAEKGGDFAALPQGKFKNLKNLFVSLPFIIFSDFRIMIYV